tara:strand:- start:2401 stop:3621 length:1221 start_codon:yes stop_codon:yes gene_type:complete
MNILYYTQVEDRFENLTDLEEIYSRPSHIWRNKFWDDVNFLNKPSAPYILIINHDTHSEKITNFLHDNPKLINDLKDNKSYLILTSHEGAVNDQGISKFVNLSDDLISNIKNKNICNISTTKPLFEVSNYMFLNRWMINLSGLTNKKIYKNLFLKSQRYSRKYHFYTINSLPRYHRVELYLFLKENKLLSKTNGTFFTSVHDGKFPFDDIGKNSYSLPRNQISITENYDKLLDDIKNEIPKGGLGMDIRKQEIVSPSIFLNLSRNFNSYFNIITPSIFFNDVDDEKNHIYFDEKYWKPFITFHPFLIIGKPYILKTLREFGFKTFSPYIDESYDTELDYFKRRDKIQKEILRLCNMKIEEIDNWYWNMSDILLHNFKWLKKYASQENEKFFSLIKKQLKILKNNTY